MQRIFSSLSPFRRSRIIKRGPSKRSFTESVRREVPLQIDEDERKIRDYMAQRSANRQAKMNSENIKQARCCLEPIIGGFVSVGNGENASPWDKIDYVGAVCFTGNWERHSLLVKELSRVGIKNCEITWSMPSPYRNFLFQRIPHIKEMDKHPGYFGATAAQYIMLKKAYELGARTALLMEDDCRFLKNIDSVKERMRNLPSDWDILMLDCFHEKPQTAKVYQGWTRCLSSYSTACYVVNRKAMRRLIQLYESPLLHKSPLRNCDHWTDEQYLGPDVKIYCATPNLAIQCYCAGSTNGGSDYMQKRYRAKGIDMGNYEEYGESINVLYCVNSDARARRWMEYSIDSLLKMYGKAKGVNVFVASDSPYSRNGVRFIDARPYIEKYRLSDIQKIQKHGRTPSPMQVFRLAAPCIKELEDFNKILYIDIDTEIAGTGLSWLFEQEFNADVMALFEHSKHGSDSTRVMLADQELVKMMSGTTISRLQKGGYFNSGVMLMNLAHIRRRYPNWGEILPSIVDMAVRHHRIVVDQDIINVVFDALPLPTVFNVMPDTDVAVPDRPPVIVHYANTSKYKTTSYPPPSVRQKIIK